MLRNVQKNQATFFIIGIYLVLGLAVLSAYRYQINPDGLSYIQIAKAYLRLDWPDAVNAYWSPLFSWLLVPLLALKMDPQLAAKLIQLSIGAGLLYQAFSLMGKLFQNRTIQTLITSLLIFPVISWALPSAITPDLLLAFLIIWFLNLDMEVKGRPVLRGLVGGIAYLAKSFALPFVIFYYVGSLMLAVLHGDFRSRLPATLISLSVTLLVALSWGTIISRHEQKPTLGTSSAYNFALVGPGVAHPMLVDGLIAPPTREALSVWDNPSVLKIPAWNPLQQRDYALKLLFSNLGMEIGVVWTYSWAVIMLSIFWMLMSLKNLRNSSYYMDHKLLLAIALWLGGYALILVESRYLFPVFIMATIAAGSLWRLVGGEWKKALVGIISTTAVVLSLGWSSITDLATNWNVGKPLFELSQKLKKVVPEGSRIASVDRWHDSLYIAYYLGGRYYGMLPPDTSIENKEMQLSKASPNYLLIWDDPSQLPVPGELLASEEGVQVYKR